MNHRLAAPAIAGALIALALAVPVLAHAELVESDPPDKAVLAIPPTTITLTFSEALDAKSKFKLQGAGGTLGTGRVGDEPDAMVLAGLDLVPGDYEIQWTSVADDGHVERGTLTFTVSEPTPVPATPTPAPSSVATPAASAAPSAASPATPAPSTPPTPVPSAAPTEPVASSSGDVVLPILAALVLVAGVGVFVLRRSRRA